MKVNLSVKIGKLKLNNPVMVASGTFGYAEEFKDFINLKKLGAIVTKTITLSPRRGNPPARTCETPSGMLNSIGLENPGLEAFLKDKLPFLEKLGIPIIMSIASEEDPREFIELVKRLNRYKAVSGLELNISCPNVMGQESLISQDCQATYSIVKSIRRITAKTLITKLSPNVTRISDIAKAAQEAGSDCVALINTLSGMSINAEKQSPRLAAVVGGVSGPAIRPVALKMVWEAYNKINIPIIGMGGIIDTSSALEFFIAGASAISIGTANFINPRVSVEIISGLGGYLKRKKIKDIRSLTGSLIYES
ncbi:MAG: Dihydroorotate dehydrogenase B (NAD(+)), catalytic subunit [Candidatus Omnitrophica bacterium ADurb.Bin205]|nr:MAG: Dihydroorotate dehydrogenase B (NAD(+)), catalytic subunit [Candidatus Omnitrophica bacterium ADurb.Bin205]